VVAVLVAAIATAIGLVHGKDNSGPAILHPAGGPVVNARAFARYGRLVFVSRDTLWALDGNRGSLRQLPVPSGLHPIRPELSPDGKWLAYEATTEPPSQVPSVGYGQVWLAHGDGTDAHPLAGLAQATLIGWNSTGDVLAALAGPLSTRIPFDSETTLRLIRPDRGTRVLVRARDVESATWSPNGTQLAVVAETPRLSETVAAYPIDGGAPTRWLTVHQRDHLNGMTEPQLSLAGWWAGIGIGVWVFGDGSTHNLDATPLDVIASPDARPRFVAATLSDGTTRVVQGRGGSLAVVADVSHGVNGNRIVWDAKQLQICRSSCQPVLRDRSRVTLDPAWSSDGNQVVFVDAPDLAAGGWPQAQLQRWYDSHVLRVLDVRSGHVKTIRSAIGATAPLWSSDGRSLVYFAHDSIWLLSRLTGRPVRIAGPIFFAKRWPAFYGQMAWPSEIAWSS
jgi:WD40 repeat protein